MPDDPVFTTTYSLVGYPDPVLLQKAKEVDPKNPSVSYAVNNMIVIMQENNGAGLAAPQVGLSWRVFIALGEVWINPEITVMGGGYESKEEGCLSIPNVTFMIRRAKQVSITGFNLDGERVTKVSESPLVARVWQHENDHLNGVLINKTIKKRSFKKRKKGK